MYIYIYTYTHGIATKTPLGHPCVLITDGYESTIIYIKKNAYDCAVRYDVCVSISMYIYI